ncbi:hypothetical protein B5M09_010988 [Aphanomyces astaci]|uniref:Long-chain-alcohol oxidase n=1 Tax=Aphanomyces astaci TaxID=112090 RepID=A0A3R7WEP6_APHAT|nr:hypothetical protein B5M09_010988 [Aphanomyces astaci]
MTLLSDQQKTTLAAIVSAFVAPLSEEDATGVVAEHLKDVQDNSVARTKALEAFAQMPPPDLGVVDTIASKLAFFPADKRNEFLQVLDLLATGWGTYLLTGSTRFVPFHDLSLADREHALLNLSQSRFALLRSLFRALKALCRHVTTLWFVLAAELAQAGHRVLVLEQGKFHHPADSTFGEMEEYEKQYADSVFLVSEDGSMQMLAGKTWGGGTAVNWYHSVPNQVLLDGCAKLNFPVHAIPQNTNGHTHSCGFCSLGCPYGEKQGSHVTWLQDAAAAGAKFIAGCKVDKVTYTANVATGVKGTVLDGKVSIVVRAKTVVSACGGVYSPALLLRSGLQNPNIGRNMRLHPVTTIYGFLPTKVVKSWEGSIMTSVTDVVSNVHGNGYNVHNNQVMTWHLLRRQFSWFFAIGRPRVHFELGPKDAKSMVEGMIASAKILLSQGAIEVNTSHLSVPALRLDTPEDRANPVECETSQAWFRQLRATGIPVNSLGIFSAHQMSSCRMAATPAKGAVNSDGETWDVQGLYVADSSVFPTASGVK